MKAFFVRLLYAGANLVEPKPAPLTPDPSEVLADMLAARILMSKDTPFGHVTRKELFRQPLDGRETIYKDQFSHFFWEWEDKKIRIEFEPPTETVEFAQGYTDKKGVWVSGKRTGKLIPEFTLYLVRHDKTMIVMTEKAKTTIKVALLQVSKWHQEQAKADELARQQMTAIDAIAAIMGVPENKERTDDE